jgi:hypothetical protein
MGIIKNTLFILIEYLTTFINRSIKTTINPVTIYKIKNPAASKPNLKKLSLPTKNPVIHIIKAHISHTKHNKIILKQCYLVQYYLAV